ncbi:MAG TPA: hypothetical protein VN616_17470 [Puia sp.]|nr:hypothetical protein [Puia sp.]
MRIELQETALIDRYLLRQLDEAAMREVEACMLASNAFAETVEAQRLAHRLIRFYGRRQERHRLGEIYRILHGEPGFARQIANIFA